MNEILKQTEFKTIEKMVQIEHLSTAAQRKE